MIIYRDICTENKDEIISDTFDLKDVGDGLLEADLSMVTVGGESFQLAGANPSAEEEAEGEDLQVEKKLDIVVMFRLNQIEAKPSKKVFTSELKSYVKRVLTKLKEAGKPEEDLKAFQTSAAGAFKKILANYDDYDLYVGEAMEEGSMYVLVNYRDDGVTPYATVWKWGLEEYKV